MPVICNITSLAQVLVLAQTINYLFKNLLLPDPIQSLFQIDFVDMALLINTRINIFQITSFFAFSLILILLSCERGDKRPNLTDEAVVAKIGNQVITAKEFRNDYEVGFPHLRMGPNPKRAYLEYMINEKLLALKGYELGLHQSEYVKNNEQRLLNQLMVEAVLERDVMSGITVTEEEIKNEVNKSKVSFKFRYWVEPTLEKANLIAADMRERGYAEVLNDIMQSNPEVRINPRQYESDYLTPLEVPVEVLNAIKDLPYGDISDPVELDGKYFIFQVLDIRRSGVTENEYNARASTFEQIIFYSKYKEKVNGYIEDLMQPQNVVTKAEAFNLFTRALKEWLNIDRRARGYFPAQVKEATSERPSMKALKEKLHLTFFTHKDGKVSIEEFLPFFNASRFLRQLSKDADLPKILNLEVKNAIRDYFLVQRAERLNLHNAPELQRELNLWRDKWIYDVTRRHLARDLELEEEWLRSYFDENRNLYKTHKDDQPQYASLRKSVEMDAYRHQANLMLKEEVELLKKRFPVEINQAVLDTITVVDFKKSPWATLQVFKGRTGRPAIPMVDPFWEPDK